MSENPKVELRWPEMFCHRHLARLVPPSSWPDGGAPAMLAMFEAAVGDWRVIDLCPRGEEGLAEAQGLNGVFAEHGPMCCFLGEERFLEVEHRFVAKIQGVGSGDDF